MTIQFPVREQQPDGSYLVTEPAFWLIDDGRNFDVILREGRRFPSMSAAAAERKPSQGLWEITRRRVSA